MAEIQPVRVVVCTSMKCSLRSLDEAHDLLLALEGKMGLTTGKTVDGVSLFTQQCFSECDYGPNVELNGEIHNDMSGEMLLAMIRKLQGG